MSCTASSPYESPLLRGVLGPALRPGGTALTDRALAVCDFPPGAHLLDVGCGAGATVEYVSGKKGFRITGLDPSAVLLEEGRRRAPELPLLEGRAEELPLPGESMEGVLCECVLSLLEDPRKALEEFRRVLRPGGYLILSDLYGRSQEPGGRWLGRQELEALLQAQGFQVLLWEDHTQLLKELAARLVLAGGSLEAICGPGERCPRTPSPGYYLLVGRLGKPFV